VVLGPGTRAFGAAWLREFGPVLESRWILLSHLEKHGHDLPTAVIDAVMVPGTLVVGAWGNWLASISVAPLSKRRRLRRIDREISATPFPEELKILVQRWADYQDAIAASVATCLKTIRPLLLPSRSRALNDAVNAQFGALKSAGWSDYRAMKQVSRWL